LFNSTFKDIVAVCKKLKDPNKTTNLLYVTKLNHVRLYQVTLQ
jgi:hypothetical protein